MKKTLAIFALCLFGFYGVTQGQALAGSAVDKSTSIEGAKAPRMMDPTKEDPAKTKSDDVKGNSHGGGVKKP